MDTDTPPTDSTPIRRRSIFATLKGLLFTVMVLAALWFALRYVLTPLVLPKEAHVAVASTDSTHSQVAALEERVTTLERRESPDITSLEARIAALENAPKPETPDAAPTAHNEDIEALKAKVDTLAASQRTTVQGLILTGQLQDAIRAGRPFASELTALISLRPELKDVLAPLAQASPAGIATLDGLRRQFAQSIDPALAPSGDEEESIGKNLRSLVKIRKVGETQKGKDDEAVIARAEAKLVRGDVAGALQETETLSPRAMKDFAAWQDRAGLYLAAQAALAALPTRLEGGQ